MLHLVVFIFSSLSDGCSWSKVVNLNFIIIIFVVIIVVFVFFQPIKYINLI